MVVMHEVGVCMYVAAYGTSLECMKCDYMMARWHDGLISALGIAGNFVGAWLACFPQETWRWCDSCTI